MASHSKNLCGVVVSAGKMMKAVKHFLTYQSHLVSDPNDSLRQGDVIRIVHGWRTSTRISHVVTEIVSPWGPPIEERPPVPSEEERMEVRNKQREAKLERRRQRKGKGVVGGAEPEVKARKGGIETLIDVVK